MTPTSPVPTPTPDPGAATPDGDDRPGRRWGPARIATWLIVIGIVAFWGYTFFETGKVRPQGFLTDRTFPVAAEKVCARALADIKKLPNAHTATSPPERAVWITEGTTRLRQMQTELRAVVPDTADAAHIRQWIDDWDVYLKDRTDFAAILARNDASSRSAQYMETQKYGTQISASLDNFADVNEMKSCDTPGDV